MVTPRSTITSETAEGLIDFLHAMERPDLSEALTRERLAWINLLSRLVRPGPAMKHFMENTEDVPDAEGIEFGVKIYLGRFPGRTVSLITELLEQRCETEHVNTDGAA